MGRTVPPQPVKLFVGLLSSDDSLFDEAADVLSESFGPIAVKSGFLPFSHTQFYQVEFGTGLKRQFIFFKDEVSPGDLVEIKQKTNSMEQRWAVKTGQGSKRRINIDPGYMNLAKVVLASTKDVAHRIYLSDGIYAETTLLFRFGRFQVLDHTYPDLRADSTLDLFTDVRNRFLRKL